jgi:hypothetical protein
MGHDAILAATKREMHYAPLLRHRRIASADDVCAATSATSTWTRIRGRLLTHHAASTLLDGARDAMPPSSLAAVWVVPMPVSGGGKEEEGGRKGLMVTVTESPPT